MTIRNWRASYRKLSWVIGRTLGGGDNQSAKMEGQQRRKGGLCWTKSITMCKVENDQQGDIDHDETIIDRRVVIEKGTKHRQGRSW